jgi:hypothetical protein
VNDRGSLLRRHVPRQQLVHLSNCGDVAGARLFELAQPALELPLDVGLPAAQVPEADRVRVDHGEGGQDVDHRAAERGSLRCAEVGVDVLGDCQHLALDEGHDVERRAIHVGVVAIAERRGHRHPRRDERRDDAVLTAHVVGRLKHAAERRAPQDEAAIASVEHLEGEVGAASGDQAVAERRLDTLDVLGEPPVHPLLSYPAERLSAHGVHRTATGMKAVLAAVP